MTAVAVDVDSKKQAATVTADEKQQQNVNTGSSQQWLRSSMRRSASYVISISSSARQSLILDSKSAPFLTGLRFCYTLLLIFRTVFFIFCADVRGQFESDYTDSFTLFLNSFLSGSLIPILSMGICGVIYKRCTLFWIAAVLQQASCLCWYAKIITRPGMQLDAIYFAYDLNLVTLTWWIVREHNVAKLLHTLAQGPAAIVRVVAY